MFGYREQKAEELESWLGSGGDVNRCVQVFLVWEAVADLAAPPCPDGFLSQSTLCSFMEQSNLGNS